jgi:hypothetical protein
MERVEATSKSKIVEGVAAAVCTATLPFVSGADLATAFSTTPSLREAAFLSIGRTPLRDAGFLGQGLETAAIQSASSLVPVRQT